MAIAFDANLGTSLDTASLVTSAAAASGSRVVLFAWWYDATGTMTGLSAGGGLTWVVDHQFVGTTDTNWRTAIASADAPSGLASSTTLTPSFSAAPDFGVGIAACSFTGLATGASGYLDATSTGKDDAEETWTTNNLVTTTADTVLVAFSAQADGAVGHTPTAPAAEIHQWTVQGTTNFGATVYRIVSSASTYQIGGVWGIPVTWETNIGVAYKMGGTPPTFNPAIISHTQGGRW